MTLIERLIEAGYPREEMYHHFSDLYVFVTPVTTKVINEWCEEHEIKKDVYFSTFKDSITGKAMYDCFFQWYETDQGGY